MVKFRKIFILLFIIPMLAKADSKVLKAERVSAFNFQAIDCPYVKFIEVPDSIAKAPVEPEKFINNPLLIGTGGVVLGAILTVAGSYFPLKYLERGKLKIQKTEEVIALLYETLRSLGGLKNYYQGNYLTSSDYQEYTAERFNSDLLSVEQKLTYAGILIRSYLEQIAQFRTAFEFYFDKEGFVAERRKFLEGIRNADAEQLKPGYNGTYAGTVGNEYRLKNIQTVHSKLIALIVQVETNLLTSIDILIQRLKNSK